MSLTFDLARLEQIEGDLIARLVEAEAGDLTDDEHEAIMEQICVVQVGILGLRYELGLINTNTEPFGDA